MSCLSRHDNDCNTGDVVPVPQTTDPTLTNVDMADPTVQTTVLNHPPPPRSKQIRLRWMSTAPMAKTLGKQARNCTQTLVLHLQRNTYHQQVLDSYATYFGISLNFQEESLFSNVVESSPVSCQPGSLISDFIWVSLPLNFCFDNGSLVETRLYPDLPIDSSHPLRCQEFAWT